MIQVVTRTLLVLMLTTATAAADPLYSSATGSYYDYINCCDANGNYTQWTWLDAKADAESRTYMGRTGHLVSITSFEEEQFLIANWWGDILYGQPHIGGFRLPGSDPVTGWQWVTGEPFVYTNWRIGEPNNVGGQEIYLHYQSTNVASTTVYGTWGWNDMLNERRGYFIEYSAPEPSVLVFGLLAVGALGRRLRRREIR